MTTFFDKTVTCPNCAEDFTVQVVGSTNTFGGQTTDFRRLATGAQPTSGFIHTCPRCGFTGTSKRYDRQVSPQLSAFIAERITPLVRDEPPVAFRRFEFAAWIAREEKGDPDKIADFYLRAAWCCEDAGLGATEENNRYLRGQAIEYFEKALDQQSVRPGDRAVITYLVGELYRRVGDGGSAAGWFDKAIALAGQAAGTEWVATLAEQQKTSPRDLMGQ